MMGGSAGVPGSTELITLIQVLADPAKTKASLKSLVDAKESADKAQEEATKEITRLEAVAKEAEINNAAERATLDGREQVASQKEARALTAIGTLDGEYRETGKKLQEKVAQLDQREVILKSKELEAAKNFSVREEKISRTESEITKRLAQAEIDNAAATQAREVYEQKLNDLNSQLAKLSR